MSTTHLLFVVNVILFCYRDEENLKKLLGLFDSFCAGTLMEINYNKSTCYWNNINKGIFSVLETFLPFEKIVLGDGLKYLEFFMKPNNYLKNDWSWLLSRVERKFKL